MRSGQTRGAEIEVGENAFKEIGGKPEFQCLPGCVNMLHVDLLSDTAGGGEELPYLVPYSYTYRIGLSKNCCQTTGEKPCHNHPLTTQLRECGT